MTARFSRRAASILLLSTLLSAVTNSYADDLRPLYIEMTLLDEDRIEARIKIPPQVPMANFPRLQLPAFCQPESGIRGTWSAATYRCDAPIRGEQASLHYPLKTVALPTVVRFADTSGSSQVISLRPGDLTWQIPAHLYGGRTLHEYVRLGVEHIRVGVDHLLFLVCLVWIAGTWQRILLTITGFTLAHSATLALATLDLLRVPVDWVEAMIALSVLFLAIEVIKGRGRNPTLTWRYPLAVSSLFGLVHGLGFAVVLSDIGLPSNEIATALVGFNLGVEIGQVVFIVAVLALIGSLRSLFANVTVREIAMRCSAGYLVGSISAYWLIDRLTILTA